MIYFAGLDFGTSGARICVMDEASEVSCTATTSYSLMSTASWRSALFELIERIPLDQRHALQSLAISGTSATILLTNETGEAICAPLIYNDARATQEAEWLCSLAPPHSIAASTTSSLAKLAWLSRQKDFHRARYVAHQADWLAMQLHGLSGLSDYHNALKLGYDLENFCWPPWVMLLPFAGVLPEVHPPGEAIASLREGLASQLQLNPTCIIRAGTTDSIAAFFASGAKAPGEAVTSLGSTLVLKSISADRVENAQYGIYSHHFGDYWLTGGASNSGGAVLKAFFSDAELTALSLQIDPLNPARNNYYPLLKPGERFPINDPLFLPQLTPRPKNKARFLHNLLEGIAHIEARGYRLLEDCGATPITTIFSAGLGAVNPSYQAIRERVIGKKITVAAHIDAAYGAALLAKLGKQIFNTGQLGFG